VADFIFDGPNRLMIEPPGLSVVDVRRDLYSAWKRWVVSGVGARFLPAFELEGGRPIGNSGIATGVTFVMINGWRIRLAERDHETTFVGNFFSADDVYTVPTLGGFTATPIFQRAVDAQVQIVNGSGNSSCPTAEEIAAQVIDQMLHVDIGEC